MDVARQEWVAAGITSYSFELTMQVGMIPGGTFSIRVVGGQVVEVLDSEGQASQRPVPTIETIWTQLLAARAEGTIKTATFDSNGVPVETLFGQPELDSGYYYSIRNFVPSGQVQ